MRDIVSDAGPILAFARAGQLDVLRQIVEELWIPGAVHEEIVIHGHGRPGSNLPSWVKVRPVTGGSEMRLSTKLGAGESEAHRLGLTRFGSLKILEEAKRRGIIAAVKPVLDEMVTAGMYVGEPLYTSFLRRLSEI